MVIDLIMDRKDGCEYNPHDFYIECMEYGKVANEITMAMDTGTENDVRKALCNYIDKQQYNPEIKNYINSENWLV